VIATLISTVRKRKAAALPKPGGRLQRYGLKRNLASLKWQTELPLATSLSYRSRLLGGGFTAASAATYALELNNPHDYLSDLAAGSDHARRSNGPFAVALFSDKLLSHMLMRPHIRLPELLALVERGHIFPFQRSDVADVDSLLEYCQEVGAVILKPAQGMKGGGVVRLEGSGASLTINGQAGDKATVAALVARLDDYLIEACVTQSGHAASIFPGAANTLRLVTIRDVDNAQEPFIAAAIHKFGTKTTVPTDNWTRGGLSAAVDLETGVLGPAVRNARHAGSAPVWSPTHPDTGAQIEGVRVPHWPQVKECVLAIMTSFNFLVYIGWDILITDAGPCLIEGNTGNIGVRSLQVHRPLLRDPRVRRFFEFYEVIAPSARP
jgi:hypothetical protein